MLASYNRLAALRLNSCTQLVLVVEEMLAAVGVPVFARDSARVVERGPVGRVALKLDGDDHAARPARAALVTARAARRPASGTTRRRRP